MLAEFLKKYQSEPKIQNKNLIVLGSKNSGKRSLIDSLMDLSKTDINYKKWNVNWDKIRMRQKGKVTGIDYGYLNVNDLNDADHRIKYPI